MGLFVTLVCVIGWYFVLGFFPGLHQHGFHVFGTFLTWYTVLLVGGAILLIKVCSKIK